MPDKTSMVWALLSKKGKLLDIGLKKLGGFKNIRVRYHTPNKRGMGRSKGNSHERETARILSKWIFGKSNPKHLKRTPLSGGWSSSKMGDVCIDPEVARQHGLQDPPMYVECRNYKDVLQYNILSWTVWKTPKVYSDWIKEVESKCDGRLPILVIKGKGTDAWIFMLDRWFPRGSSYQALRDNSPVHLRTDEFGRVFMLPLKRVRSLGDGEKFFTAWVKDGGRSQLRAISRSP